MLFTIFSIFCCQEHNLSIAALHLLQNPIIHIFVVHRCFNLCACRSPRRAHKLSCMACDTCLLHKNVKHKSICMCVKTNLDAGANFVEEIQHFPEIPQYVWIMYEDLQKNSMWHGRRGKYKTYIRTMFGVILKTLSLKVFYHYQMK